MLTYATIACLPAPTAIPENDHKINVNVEAKKKKKTIILNLSKGNIF